MFISKIKKKIKVGDNLISVKDINIKYGVFSIGHKFKCLGISNDYIDIIDNEHGVKFNIHESYLSVDVNIHDAIKYDKRHTELEKVYYQIKKHCPNVEEDYFNRSTVDVCKSEENKKYYKPACEPCLGCLKYISNDVIKNNKLLLKESRLLKINKLKDGL